MMRILILALLFSFSTSAQTLNPSQITELKKVIWSSIHKKHTAEGTTQFNGSYDWHSDVHAHWALLSMARVTRDAALEKRMLSILTVERLEEEARFLLQQEWTRFEKPYGRAWMLLLLWELSQRDIGNDPRFQKVRWDLTRDLLHWLQNAKLPENPWNKSFIGTHDSWLMSLFLFDTAKSDDIEIKRNVEDLVRHKLLPLASEIENHAMETNDFLFLPAVKHLILPQESYNRPILPIPQNEFACHYPGAIQVSLWAHSVECARQNSKSCEMIKSMTQEFFSRKNLWESNFDCVSHWVPQFIWMTHWLSLGKP